MLIFSLRLTLKLILIPVDTRDHFHTYFPILTRIHLETDPHTDIHMLVPPGKPPPGHWLKYPYGRLILNRKAELTPPVRRARPPLLPGKTYLLSEGFSLAASTPGWKTVVISSADLRLLYHIRRGLWNYHVGIISGLFLQERFYYHVIFAVLLATGTS